MSSRRGIGAVAAGALAAIVLVVPVRAGISGPCSATINGESVADRSTGASGSPIVVERHSQVPVTMSAGTAISQLKVKIEFAGSAWTVHDEPTTGTSWSKNVNVDKYAKYGVGLYKVSGSSSGAGIACTGAALVRVKGNPIATVAGGAGLGVAIVSALGLLLIGFRGRGTLSLVGGPILGLIGGLAVGVLLQQFSVLYPTRAVAIAELAVGAAIGLGVPMVAKLMSGGTAAVRSAHGRRRAPRAPPFLPPRRTGRCFRRARGRTAETAAAAARPRAWPPSRRRRATRRRSSASGRPAGPEPGGSSRS